MILTKEVQITGNPKNMKHYQEQGIEVKYGQKYMMPVKYLPKYCGYKIEAQCENCGDKKELPMQKYSNNKDRGGKYYCKACNNITLKKSMLEKYGVDNASKNPESIEKRKQTCLEKYGNEYYVATDESRVKVKETLIERYGGHHMKLDEFKFKSIDKSLKTKLERGLIVADEYLTEWDIYRKKVRKLTERNRIILMERWDGTDYYDGKYIKDNFTYKHTDGEYPTLDHKISILHGFQNKMPAKYIAGTDNLCITKKSHNSSKGSGIEDDFDPTRKYPVM